MQWNCNFLFITISFLIFKTSYLNGFVLVVPPHWKTALMARYIVHKSDWLSISTISAANDIKGYPFVNLKSMSDGPINDGKGIPYIYLTDMDISGNDIKSDNKVSVMATLAQSDYCKSEDLDPQDPRCARVLLTGTIVKVTNNTEEYDFAKNALFTRHPAMKKWPIDHNFFIAKVNIERIAVLDYFGGVKFVTLKDYLDASPNSTSGVNYRFKSITDVEVFRL